MLKNRSKISIFSKQSEVSQTRKYTPPKYILKKKTRKYLRIYEYAYEYEYPSFTDGFLITFSVFHVCVSIFVVCFSIFVVCFSIFVVCFSIFVVCFSILVVYICMFEMLHYVGSVFFRKKKRSVSACYLNACF